MEKKYIFVEHYQTNVNEPFEHTIYEMSAEEFEKLVLANAQVAKIYRFEELFLMLINNLFDFNKIVLFYADKMRLQSLDYVDSLQIRVDVNRVVLNFFATLTTYFDFIKQNFNNPLNCKSYDSNKKLQRCLAMRNYIQHIESFPVKYNICISQGDLNVKLSTINFQVNIADLKIDQLKKCTQKKFNSFFEANEDVDLYETINQGFGEIQALQKEIRKNSAYSEEYLQSKKFFLKIEEKIARTTPGRHVFFESDKTEKDLQHCNIATDMIKFIDENVKTYSCYGSIAEYYITTAPKNFAMKCAQQIFVPEMQKKLKKQNNIQE